MNYIFTLRGATTLALSMFLLVSCQDNEKLVPSCVDAEWEYGGPNGPGDWQVLCVDFGACAGTVQSPVNIANAVDDNAFGAITEHYVATQTHIVHKGHTLQFNVDAGNEITVNGETYKLLQFHTHTPSEHVLNGRSYPMEVHFVHQNEATGKLAVIGVFVEEGAANAFLAPFVGHLPQHKGDQYDTPDAYTVADFLPANQSYFTYPGSLTTPPCSEIVTWIVLENPVEASAEQIESFEHLEHHNNRPLQQINTRTIRHFHS